MHSSSRNLRRAAVFAVGSLAALGSARAQTPAAPTTSVAAATATSVAPYASQVAASITLKDAAKGLFYMGVAIRPDQINGQNPQSAALITREFNSISPENVMKMGPIHPRPGNDPASYNFEPADQFVEFGVKNHLVIIGHNLCWHSQMPAWMGQPEPGQDTLTKEILLARLHDHIMTVAGRYKGKIHGWDVVNEAINDGEGDYRQSVFYRVIGKEFLVHAFKWAHEADPAAELYYNDYNLDANDKKRATAIELVKYLRENGAPIHGIGMQGHYNLTTPSIEKIDETIGMFAALGLKVHITELDVTAIRGTSVSGAVGFNPNAPAPAAGTPAAANAAPPPQPPGGRGRGGLPSLDTLKADVKLTDAQVAAIAPILEKATQETAASMGSGDFARVAQIRTEALATLGKLVNEDQKAALTTALTPAGRGGRGPAAPVVPLTPELAQEQARRYGEIFGVFLKYRNSIARVTFWGLRDSDSWRRQNHPLVFTDDYGRKPAYDAVVQSLAKMTTAK